VGKDHERLLEEVDGLKEKEEEIQREVESI